MLVWGNMTCQLRLGHNESTVRDGSLFPDFGARSKIHAPDVEDTPRGGSAEIQILLLL